MSKINITPLQIHGWQGHQITCGPLSIGLAPSIGGRIISLRYEGKELLFVDQEHAGEVFDFSAVPDLNARKREMGFQFWGGDKTWVAPQRDWQEGIPPLELDAGNYTLLWEGQTAVMASPQCRETGVRIIRKLTVQEDMTVRLCEEMHNPSDAVVRRGIWNVTQVTRPCVFYVPAVSRAFRSYHHEDKTLPEVKDIFQENQGWVEVTCRQPLLFKCGGMPKEGRVMIRMPIGGRHEVVWLKSFAFDPKAAYAHNSAVEIFNSPTHNYAEIELHAPIAELQPGAYCCFEQNWNFKKI